MISVGRWTPTATLLIHIIKLPSPKKTIILERIPADRIHDHSANDTKKARDIPAWSEGNGAVGKCDKINDWLASRYNSGLDLITKDWISKLQHTVMTHATNIVILNLIVWSWRV